MDTALLPTASPKAKHTVGLQRPGLHWGLPVNDQGLVGGLLVTNGAGPRGLLLVHLQVKGRIKTLEVSAGVCSTRDRQLHLAQLEGRKEGKNG